MSEEEDARIVAGLLFRAFDDAHEGREPLHDFEVVMRDDDPALGSRDNWLALGREALRLGARVPGAAPAISFLREGTRILGLLAAVAEAYDEGGLDEARPERGRGTEIDGEIAIVAGRGGRILLKLGDALAARELMRDLGKASSR